MVRPPMVIQGGMGVGVSGWRLAQAVSRLGHLGVVSGTGLDVVHARRLGDGDPGGHLRRAYAHAPVPGLAERVLERWFVPGGRGPGERYRRVPMARIDAPVELRELTILANFAEVWLAREGHDGPVGINYLEKVRLPLVPGFYGAMLAGVDVVLMGAGIPAQVPGVLTDLALGRPAAYRLSVAGAAPGDDHAVRLDPAEVFGSHAPELPRPRFAAIISSNTLASFLLKDPHTTPDWFVVEGATAGGHNAPPRGPRQLDPEGQPVYGPRDRVDLDRMAATGIPFWLAGGYGGPEQLQAARLAGAAGVQVGTAFALCDESDLREDLKADIIGSVLDRGLRVHTDPLASPSGFPFKVVRLPGTVADDEVYAARRRVCDLGYLRTAYTKPDGTVGYRCPSEPVDTYVAKGGKREDTVGRTCLCNALMATVDLAQERSTGPEAPIVTAGDDLERVVRSLAGERRRWTAADVIGYLVGPARGARPPWSCR